VHNAVREASLNAHETNVREIATRRLTAPHFKNPAMA